MKYKILVYLFIIIGPFFNTINCKAEGSSGKFNYNIDAKLLPEKDELIGSYTARFVVSDSNLSKEIVIYAPKKPHGNKNYLSLSVLYNEDPIRTWDYDEYIEIEEIKIDGEEYDLSKAKREKKYLIINYGKPKKLNSTVVVSVKFKTHFLGVKNNLYVATWYPYLNPSNYKEIFSWNESSNVTLRIPKNYNLLANCENVDSLGIDDIDNNYARYNLSATKLRGIIWIASPHLKMVYKSSNPIDWSLWSGNNHVPMQIIDTFEKQMSRYLELYGYPTNHKAHLNVCLMPLGHYMAGGSTGNLIVLDAGIFKWSLFRQLYPIIPHELGHFWWTNHDYGTYTKRDLTFVESFNDHLLDFFKDKIVREKPGKILSKLAPGLIKSADNMAMDEYKINARSGRHYAVFPKSEEPLYNDDTGHLIAEDMENKGIVLLNALSREFSREEWTARVKRFFKETRNKAMTFDLFCQLNPDIAPTLNEWFKTAGDFDYALGRIRCEKDKSGFYHSVIPVINKDSLSSDVEMLVTFDDGTTSLDTVKMDRREVQVKKVSNSKIKKVVIDPNQLIPDYDRTNNRNFRSVKFCLSGRSLVSDSLDSYQISFHYLPIPAPDYSDETGFSLVKNLLMSNGLTKRFGCAGRIRDDYLSFDVGYNFRASDIVWSFSSEKVISLSKIKSFVAANASMNPERLFSSLNLVLIRAVNWNRPPVYKLTLGPYYTRLRYPNYRSRDDWAEGDLIGLHVFFKTKNVVSFRRKVSGYIFSVSADKVFKDFGSDWDFERATMQTEFYSPLSVNLVLASRIFAGNIWGYAPLQERFDLARHGLFSANHMYDNTGRSIFSYDVELRLAKVFPIFDLALFSRNSWLQNYSSKGYSQYDEAGLSFRFFKYFILDIGLWNKMPYPKDSNGRGITFSLILGSPFSYSSVRWYR